MKGREGRLPDSSNICHEVYCLINREDAAYYYGLCQVNGRVIDGVRFPKDKIRELTPEERMNLWFVGILDA